jgi:SAM-dependent methyltransferase
MYDWEIAPGVRTAVLHAELPSVHATRAALIEPLARQALAAAGPGATAIDLACSEGWFSQRLLEWGAARALGVDVRADNIHRAELIRDHFGLDPQRLRFEVADVFDLAPGERFDVVLCLGLIYHLENPIGALRVARALTRGVCIVESQLTEQVEPIRHGWGVTGEFLERPASWAAWYEPRQSEHPIASHGGVVSFIPNRAALMEALSAAGFAAAEPLVPSSGNAQYVEGHRLVVAARP